MISENGRKEIFMNFPAEDTDARQGYRQNAARTPEHHSPLPPECKINEQHYRKIFDRYEETETQPSQQRSPFKLCVVTKNTRQRHLYVGSSQPPRLRDGVTRQTKRN